MKDGAPISACRIGGHNPGVDWAHRLRLQRSPLTFDQDPVISIQLNGEGQMAKTGSN
jgi:hypothetical protein